MLKFTGGENMVEKRTEDGWRKKSEYKKAYDKANRVAIKLKLNKATEPELIEYWQSIPNKTKWVKDHLRAELEQKAGE